MRVEEGTDSRQVRKTVRSEAMALVRRDPNKYIPLVGGLYLLSVHGLRLGQLGRSSYFFARHIDDVLDGDRQISGDPQAYALALRDQVAERKFNLRDPIAQLAEQSLRMFGQIKRPGDNPQQDLVDLIDVMIFDHERARERRALSGDQLEEYYGRTINPGTNLMLIGFRSDLRASEIPQLATELGRIYSARDLNDDWAKGIINIPLEILEEAGLTTNSEIAEVRANFTICKWFQEELALSKDQLRNLQDDPRILRHKTTRVAVGGLIKRALRYSL